ncbi:HUL5 [Candida jiufengensis]|uniref:HUL5 n=1 Tax=Candida jiufengensis TaxID=497108 RepID=UPI002225B4D6|nr:HUL5 [Candida jiufengensis]KAI5955323.1 HUL5 [Candida jiufengensis]
MLNFSGQTKKRSVNLGNNKSTGFGNRNFLEQSRLQRNERQEIRNREKSAVILQRNITNYLRISKDIKDLLRQWNEFEINESNEWGQFILDSISLSRWFATRNSEIENSILVNLNSQLEDISKPEISLSAINILGNYLTPLIKNNRVSYHNKYLIFQVLRFLYQKYQFTTSQLLSNLNSLLEESELNATSSESTQILNFIYTINDNGGDPDYFIPFIQVLYNYRYIQPNPLYLTILRNVFDPRAIDCLQTFKDNSPRDFFNKILLNFLTIHGNEMFIDEDYHLLSILLIYNNSKIVDSSQDIEVSKSKEVFEATTAELNTLDKLYTSNFLQTVIQQLEENNLTSFIILFKISYLRPSLKHQVYLQLCVNPRNISLLYDNFANEIIFKVILQYEDEIPKTIAYTLFDQPMFWDECLFFEEVYSYWLIISNDGEFFEESGLSATNILDLCKFLKSVCLNIVDIENGLTKELQEQSNKLIDQLYLKNLRLKFLPTNFWLTESFNYNIPKLIEYLVDDYENIADSDDEDLNDQAASKKPLIYSKVIKILFNTPYFIPFNERVMIFQGLVEKDKDKITPNLFFQEESRLGAEIRRQNLLEDAFESFGKAGEQFKHKIQVEFFNEYGPEAGIDGGGITKEFLTGVLLDGINPDNGLFQTTTDNQVYPNEDIYYKLRLQKDMAIQQKKLEYLRFLGMCVGKCLFENVLVDVSFAPFFISKSCMDLFKNSINDLNYLDPDLFRNLTKLSKMSNVELENLDLSFSVDIKVDHKTHNFELIPNGSKTKVNKANVQYYLHKLADFKLNQSLMPQTKYFLEGLFVMIPKKWLKMFDSFELQMLISGGEKAINLSDWKLNVEYGGYLENDLSIKLFWEIIQELNIEEKSKLIKFVTSVSRAPLLGFSTLNPKFGIRNSGRDKDRLPTASTCVNLLKLPDYQDKKIMKEKLLYAINTEAGFDLS